MIEKYPFLSREIPNIDEEFKETLKKAYNHVVTSPDGRIFSRSKEEEIKIFNGLRMAFSARGSWSVLGLFYARRVLKNIKPSETDEFFSTAGVPLEKNRILLRDYLLYKHVFEETKLCHLPLRNGYVYLDEEAKRYFAADIGYTLATSNMPVEFPNWVRDILKEGVKKTRKTDLFERILSVSGIPDGRKRIIFYWLMPYLITVRGLSTERSTEIIKEWVQRQEGEKIPESWIRCEAENVKKRNIKPWSVEKVKRVDPGLAEIVERAGLI